VIVATLKGLLAFDGVLGALSFDPHYRGMLIVATAVIILCGGVYLLLATNTGARLGGLISLAGFFGWMFIMGIVWTIYGIGYEGRAPGWLVDEVVVGDLANSANPDVRSLPDRDQSYDLVEEAILNQDDAYAELTGSQVPKSLSDLAGVNRSLVDDELQDAGVDLAGWKVVGSSEPARGEAQAVADSALVEEELAELEGRQYLSLSMFKFGGFDDPSSPAILDGVSNKLVRAGQLVTNVGNPTLYSVVQVQPAIVKPAVPGEPPPIPSLDDEAQVISVVMTRDYGTERLPPFLVTVGSGAIFLLSCLMLHSRDKTLATNLAKGD